MEPQLDVAELEQWLQKITEDLQAFEQLLSDFKDDFKIYKNSLEMIPNKNEVVAKLEKRVEAVEEKHKLAHKIQKEMLAAIKRYRDGSITMEILQQTLDGLRQMRP